MSSEQSKLKIGKRMKFIAKNIDDEKVKLSDYKGHKIISMFPQLNTRFCDIQTETVRDWSDKYTDITFISISSDSASTAKEWCGAHNKGKSYVLSDEQYRDFGTRYDLFSETGFMKRGFIILDDKDTVVDYDFGTCEESGKEPNYLETEANFAFVQSFLDSFNAEAAK